MDEPDPPPRVLPAGTAWDTLRTGARSPRVTDVPDRSARGRARRLRPMLDRAMSVVRYATLVFVILAFAGLAWFIAIYWTELRHSRVWVL